MSAEDDDDTSSLNTFEERMRDERRAEIRRRLWRHRHENKCGQQE